jgi:hypothetical protein
MLLLAPSMTFAQPPAIAVASGQTQITVPLELNLAREPESIAVELDGYDISAFVTPTGSQLELSLDIALSPGPHELVVLVNYPDGSIEMLVNQTLEVAGSSFFSADNWTGNVALETSYLTLKETPEDFQNTEHLHTSGGTAIEGAYSKGDWLFNVEAEALYDSNSSQTGSGNPVDLASYRAGAAWQNPLGATRLHAGDHLVDAEGLVFSRFRRRGVTLQHATGQRMVEMEAFALKSETTSSARAHELLPSAPEDRVVGTRALYRPLEGESQRHLQLSASYLTGETTDFGGGFNASQETVHANDVTGFGALSEWFDGGLALEAQYARSSFDFDGQGTSSRDDKATLYSMRFASGTYLPAGPVDQWNLRLINQTVGRHFFSLGNRFLPGDLTSNRLELSTSVDGFSLGVDLSRSTNNVDDDAAIADFSHRTAGLQGYYTPSALTPDDPLWRRLGTPSLEGSIRRTDQEQDSDDAQLVGYDINNKTDEIMAGVTFSYPDWRWSLQQTRIDVDDTSRPVFILNSQVYTPPSDTTSDLTLLQFTFYPSPYLYVAPLVQYQRVRETDSGNRYVTVRFGLDSQIHLRPDSLILNFNVSEDHSRQSFTNTFIADNDSVSRTASGQLTWKALSAQGVQPGFDVFTRASYGSFRNDGLNDSRKTWQVLLGVAATWNP